MLLETFYWKGKKIRVCLVIVFFLIFFILCFKNNFLFLKLKNLFGTTQNWQKTKTVFKIQFVKEIENMQKVFLV